MRLDRFWLPICAISVLLCAACGGGGGGTSSPIVGGKPPGATPPFGAVTRNNVPISGATVSLFAMGTAGYGSAPTMLVSATSASNGSFSFGSFTCPSAAVQTYLTAVGGNGGGGTNSAIVLVTASGPCGKLGAFVTINELTSAASVYALRQFINPANHSNIGAPASNSVGLDNAVVTIANLADIVKGQASSFLQSGGNSPQELNSLADILYACDSSSGPSSTACSNLFAAATPRGRVPPTDAL
jgi:trimeric autotransporter adhesin